MIDLDKTKNDEFYKLFHCLALNTKSKYISYTNTILQNLLKKDKNIYLLHSYEQNLLQILLCNYLYYFKKSKKMIVLYDNNCSINDYTYIFLLSKYFKVIWIDTFHTFETSSIYDFDIILTNVNNLYYFLYNFNLSHEYNYILFYKINKPHLFEKQTISLFNLLQSEKHKIIFNLYGDYYNKNYKIITKDEISICNFFDKTLKNNLFCVPNEKTSFDKFIYLLKTTNVNNSLLYISKKNKNKLSIFLRNNDISYYDLDLVTNIDYLDYRYDMKINNKYHRFHLLSDLNKIVKYYSFFYNYYIFDRFLCINRYKEIMYHDGIKKNIYLLFDDDNMIKNIKNIYNNNVKRI